MTLDKHPATIPFFFFNLQKLSHSPDIPCWWQIHSCSSPPSQKQSLPLTCKVKNQSRLPHADPSRPEATADPKTWSRTPHLDRNQQPKPPPWVQLPSHLSHSVLPNTAAQSLLPEVTPISRDYEKGREGREHKNQKVTESTVTSCREEQFCVCSSSASQTAMCTVVLNTRWPTWTWLPAEKQHRSSQQTTSDHSAVEEGQWNTQNINQSNRSQRNLFLAHLGDRF